MLDEMKTFTGIAFLGLALPALCCGQLDLNKDSVVTEWTGGQGNITNVTVDGRSLTQEEREKWLSSMGGIGTVIDVVKEGVLVKDVLVGSPAASAGLRAGDVILDIDGHSAAGVSLRDIFARIRGKPGSIVSLKVHRAADGLVQSMQIKRDFIRVPAVSKPSPSMEEPPSNKSVEPTPAR